LNHYQNEWLISVPTGRFVADASLSHSQNICCRYVNTTLSHRKHPLRCRVSGQQMSFARKREWNVAAAARCWSRRLYHRMWCF